jgi:hypothetical protein
MAMQGQATTPQFVPGYPKEGARKGDLAGAITVTPLLGGEY